MIGVSCVTDEYLSHTFQSIVLAALTSDTSPATSSIVPTKSWAFRIFARAPDVRLIAAAAERCAACAALGLWQLPSARWGTVLVGTYRFQQWEGKLDGAWDEPSVIAHYGTDIRSINQRKVVTAPSNKLANTYLLVRRMSGRLDLLET